MTLSFMIGADADLPPDYLGSTPEHDPNLALALLRKFSFKEVEFRKSIKLSFGFQTTEIGAYENAFVLSDRRIGTCCTEYGGGLLEAALSVHQQGALFFLHSRNSTNYFHYRLYEKGILIREHAGNLNDGVTVDYGQILPEEQSAFKDSKFIDGERIFYKAFGGRRPTIEEFTTDEFGEELGLMVAARFFGDKEKASRQDWLPYDLNGESFLMVQ